MAQRIIHRCHAAAALWCWKQSTLPHRHRHSGSVAVAVAVAASPPWTSLLHTTRMNRWTKRKFLSNYDPELKKCYSTILHRLLVSQFDNIFLVPHNELYPEIRSKVENLMISIIMCIIFTSYTLKFEYLFRSTLRTVFCSSFLGLAMKNLICSNVYLALSTDHSTTSIISCITIWHRPHPL